MERTFIKKPFFQSFAATKPSPILKTPFTEAKLSSQGDHYEQEADRAAERIMKMPGTVVRRQSKAETAQEVRPQR